MSDVTFDLGNNHIEFISNHAEPWRISVIDTGDKTMTGGRIKRIQDYIGRETFCLSYGDQVANVNISKLIEFHNQQGTIVTLSAVQPPGRFGVFNLNPADNLVHKFREKPSGFGSEAWVNGGFFVVNPEAFDYIAGDETVWEREPLENLAIEGKLSAFRHSGFWHPMDTLRDRNVLEELWRSGDAPWKVW
jgi:glucose-1-phosphate cytidylyltransferase